MFRGKKITVGVTGGIAAYKVAEFISWLNKNHADVHVIMTRHACEFITPLTLKTLSGHSVATELFAADPALHVPHIDLAECDLFVVIPATANILAKAATGIADDMLSSVLLATKAPIVFAPAMNTNMYFHPATQNNIALLKERGCKFIEPGEGKLACGTSGTGRLADMDKIQAFITNLLYSSCELSGLRLLVTAGPTREKIDPVRYVSNRSSGKMGYAIAEAAAQLGADVTLVSGPTALPAPANVKLIKVESAMQMHDAVWESYPTTQVVIMAAAVADYRPSASSEQKIKKGEDQTINLVQNPDILASLGKEKGDRILIGFAAETENLLNYAQKKLEEKNLDMIVANDVTQEGAGFDGDTNIITTITVEHELKRWPKMTKHEAAVKILETLCTLPRYTYNKPK